MKKTLVIIAARGIGDLIYHLPLLRSLYESYKEKLIILSNKVNHSKEVYKFETFYKEIIEFENTRFSFFKTLKTITNLKNIINKCNVDQIILTASSRRLMIPVYLSDVKEKIIFGQGKFFFTKDNKYQYLTHADKIMKYTENLNLPTKIKNFHLAQANYKSIDETKKKPHIFINLDSHHDQNNWNIKNYINIISQLLIYELKIYINFSPTKLYFLKLLPKEIFNSEVSEYGDPTTYIYCENIKYDFKIPYVKKETDQEGQARETEYLKPLKSCLNKASNDEKIEFVKSYIKSWIENWFKNPELVKTLNLYG